jgi:LCP family protein required for cell wall assembly
LTGEGHEEGRLPRAGAPLYKRFALAGILIFFLTTGAVATAALLRVKGIGKLIVPPGHAVALPDAVPPKPGKPQTILLVGSDKRFGAGKGDARSDTMMLVRLDPAQQATAVMSIPRDLVTQIPGYGTEKINGAYSYGGLNLTLKTVRDLLSGGSGGVPRKPFAINHAIGVNFKGFRNVVNFVGCIYTDVDRRYYHSNAGLPPSAQYAEIDIQPGYQRLCGQRALDYVRFRHADSDLVRAARQQDFLRSAKNQIGTGRLINDIDPLLEIIGKSTEADKNLGSTTGVLGILKLAIASAQHPVREIQFPATFVNDPKESYVTATPGEIAKAVDEFLHAKPASKPRSTGPRKAPSPATRAQVRKSRRKGPTSYAKYELVLSKRLGEDLVAPIQARGTLRFPLYFAKAMTASGRYPTSTAIAPMPRIYTLRDRADKPHQAYRIVVTHNELEGQYYGVQGTTWKNPPILDGGSEKLRMRGRTYELRYDGKRLRTVAWRTSKATYWVSNTLSLKLSNQQMRGLARSLVKLGDP